MCTSTNFLALRKACFNSFFLRHFFLESSVWSLDVHVGHLGRGHLTQCLAGWGSAWRPLEVRVPGFVSPAAQVILRRLGVHWGGRSGRCECAGVGLSLQQQQATPAVQRVFLTPPSDLR